MRTLYFWRDINDPDSVIFGDKSLDQSQCHAYAALHIDMVCDLFGDAVSDAIKTAEEGDVVAVQVTVNSIDGEAMEDARI